MSSEGSLASATILERGPARRVGQPGPLGTQRVGPTPADTQAGPGGWAPESREGDTL